MKLILLGKWGVKSVIVPLKLPNTPVHYLMDRKKESFCKQDFTKIRSISIILCEFFVCLVETGVLLLVYYMAKHLLSIDVQ